MTSFQKLLEELNYSEDDMEELKEIVRDGWEYGELAKDWKVISSSNVDYDEGNVTTENIVKHVPTGRIFKYDSVWNSWADYTEDFDVNDVVEVEEYEKIVKAYRSIEN